MLAPAPEGAPQALLPAARIRKLLDLGAPWAACDEFNALSTAEFAGDHEVLYCGALSHARVGATSRAQSLIDRVATAADATPHWRVEALSLRGRLSKDELHRASDASRRNELARCARADYLEAYAVRGDSFPGINAASLSRLLGDAEEATRLAREVRSALTAAGGQSELDGWQHATLGEAALLLGDLDASSRHYAAAFDLVADEPGTVASMRRQLRMLSPALPAAASLLPLLPSVDVVAFAGHMVDRLDQDAPVRFPGRIEAALVAALRARVEQWRRPIVYTSAACGADLLFVEAALAAGAEVNIVLPFDREDFIAVSVEVGGAAWVPRFERALERANVIYATDEAYLGDDALFGHAARLVEGLALLRAAQLEATPAFLAVVDLQVEGAVGGTRESLERWQRLQGRIDTIDLRALRDRVADDGASDPPVEGRPSAPPLLVRAPATRAARRTIKSALFADFSGFGRLHDAYAPLFHAQFLGIVAEEIAISADPPLEANTWGDALYAVFGSVHRAASFALALLDRMTAVDWTAAGLSETSQIRIALHAGPVFCGFDPILGHDNFFGSSVTLAARIEPITPTGTVYVSAAFAATLAAEGNEFYVTEYVGRISLPKRHGEMTVYRLRRR